MQQVLILLNCIPTKYYLVAFRQIVICYKSDQPKNVRLNTKIGTSERIYRSDRPHRGLTGFAGKIPDEWRPGRRDPYLSTLRCPNIIFISSVRQAHLYQCLLTNGVEITKFFFWDLDCDRVLGLINGCFYVMFQVGVKCSQILICCEFYQTKSFSLYIVIKHIFQTSFQTWLHPPVYRLSR